MQEVGPDGTGPVYKLKNKPKYGIFSVIFAGKGKGGRQYQVVYLLMFKLLILLVVLYLIVHSRQEAYLFELQAKSMNSISINLV